MPKEILRQYEGNEIITIPENACVPIVNGIVYEGDLVMFSGQYKTNKSTFAMQLACSLSSGTPFMNSFNVPKPRVVWYFSTEGKDNDTKNRFQRMIKAVPTNLDNIRLFCSSQLKINTPFGVAIFQKLIKEHAGKLPALILIDSLYSSFKGKLTDEETVNTYITAIRKISEQCNDASVILFHHKRKPSVNKEGKLIPQNDNDTFGSTFFNGQADHCFQIEISNKNKKDRVFKCETQREDRIIDEDIYLHVNGPDPFYLSLIGKRDKEKDAIVLLLSKYPEGLKANQVMEKLESTKSVTYMALGELEQEQRIYKTHGYNGVYILNKQEPITGELKTTPLTFP